VGLGHEGTGGSGRLASEAWQAKAEIINVLPAAGARF
jgi:hypothetical protein